MTTSSTSSAIAVAPSAKLTLRQAAPLYVPVFLLACLSGLAVMLITYRLYGGKQTAIFAGQNADAGVFWLLMIGVRGYLGRHRFAHHAHKFRQFLHAGVHGVRLALRAHLLAEIVDYFLTRRYIELACMDLLVPYVARAFGYAMSANSVIVVGYIVGYVIAEGVFLAVSFLTETHSARLVTWFYRRNTSATLA